MEEETKCEFSINFTYKLGDESINDLFVQSKGNVNNYPIGI